MLVGEEGGLTRLTFRVNQQHPLTLCPWGSYDFANSTEMLGSARMVPSLGNRDSGLTSDQEEPPDN